MSVLDTLKAATPARRKVRVILDAALQAEWDDALDALQEAVRSDKTRDPGASLADVPAVTGAREHLDEIRGRIAASEVVFEVEQLDWRQRLAIQAQHMPRRGHAIDETRGWNSDTYPPAIIKATVVKIVGRGPLGEPDETTDIPAEVWDHLLGVPAREPDPDDPDDEGQPAIKAALNLRSIMDLQSAAESANDKVSAVPPSARSFLAIPGSGASSTQPGPGESAPDGSEGGSPAGSPTSSTTTTVPTPDGSDES